MLLLFPPCFHKEKRFSPFKTERQFHTSSNLTRHLQKDVFSIGVAAIMYNTHMCNEMKKCTHSREIAECGDTVVPYYKGFLLKEGIRSLWEQILSFK